ncbi:hypothetical protein WJX77_001688 [Trebouxia sp. C0004]
MAQRLHLNCLTQKCEDMLAQEDFQLTTGRSTTDSHSVVKWAHIAQKHHLLALQLRCERFMCENFHKILDDPLLQGLTRHSLLRMLRAQSAMVSVYKEHVVCPQTWGLASVGRHGAKPCCTHFSSAVTGSSDNYSALDTDMASVNDSTATSEHGGRSDQDSDAEPDEISDSADSCEVTSRRRQPPPARDRASHDIVRSWSLPGLPDVLPSASQRLPSQHRKLVICSCFKLQLAAGEAAYGVHDCTSRLRRECVPSFWYGSTLYYYPIYLSVPVLLAYMM